MSTRDGCMRWIAFAVAAGAYLWVCIILLMASALGDCIGPEAAACAEAADHQLRIIAIAAPALFVVAFLVERWRRHWGSVLLGIVVAGWVGWMASLIYTH